MRIKMCFQPWCLRGVACLLALAAGAASARAAIDVLSLDAARSRRPLTTSDVYSSAREFLQNPANFGPGGVYSEPVTLHAAASVLNASTLAGMDVLVITEQQDAFTSGEVAAVRQFVLGGGRLLVCMDTTVSPVFSNALLSDLGIGAFSNTSDGINGQDTIQIVASANGTNGPFGAVGFLGSTVMRPLVAAGPLIITGRIAGVGAMGEVLDGALGSGSGRVLLTGDILFSDFATPDPDNLKYLGNWIVPSPSTLGVAGLGLVGLGVRRRRH